MNRQPVVSRALIVAAVALLLAILGRYGIVVPPDIADHLVEVVAVLAPLALAYWARRHVTPIDDPRGEDGRPLIPVATPSDLGVIAEGVAQADRHPTA